MSRISFLGLPLDCLTMSETVKLIDTRIRDGKFTQHGAVNASIAVEFQENRSLADMIGACDVINVDGMGVLWGAKLLGFDVPERIAGPDLFGEMLKLAALRGYPVFLLGGVDVVVQKAARNLSKTIPNLKIAGYNNGYFWDNEETVVRKIRASNARLLFVAISSPMKERFINRWRAELGVDFVMGVGGTFDIVAGKTKRAPPWMQHAGLEWLYRLSQEPRRMWRRNFIESPRFLMMVIRAKLHSQGKHL
jgi:N-acetylglucosaminyldiphosphoundecaprenol N-acetyl-beta-D-mannosaminyltransferase